MGEGSKASPDQKSVSSKKRTFTLDDAVKMGKEKDDAKRKTALEIAKSRIEKTDIAKDGKELEGDSKIRSKALEFVSTDCLALPDDRLDELIDEIIKTMEERDAYEVVLVEKFKTKRDKLQSEVAKEREKERERMDLIDDNGEKTTNALFIKKTADIWEISPFLDKLETDEELLKTFLNGIYSNQEISLSFLTNDLKKFPWSAELSKPGHAKLERALMLAKYEMLESLGLSVLDNDEKIIKEAYSKNGLKFKQGEILKGEIGKKIPALKRRMLSINNELLVAGEKQDLKKIEELKALIRLEIVDGEPLRLQNQAMDLFPPKNRWYGLEMDNGLKKILQIRYIGEMVWETNFGDKNVFSGGTDFDFLEKRMAIANGLLSGSEIDTKAIVKKEIVDRKSGAASKEPEKIHEDAFDSIMRSKRFSQFNSSDSDLFKQVLNKSYLLNKLNIEDLEFRWGREKILEIAMTFRSCSSTESIVDNCAPLRFLKESGKAHIANAFVDKVLAFVADPKISQLENASMLGPKAYEGLSLWIMKNNPKIGTDSNAVTEKIKEVFKGKDSLMNKLESLKWFLGTEELSSAQIKEFFEQISKAQAGDAKYVKLELDREPYSQLALHEWHEIDALRAIILSRKDDRSLEIRIHNMAADDLYALEDLLRTSEGKNKKEAELSIPEREKLQSLFHRYQLSATIGAHYLERRIWSEGELGKSAGNKAVAQNAKEISEADKLATKGNPEWNRRLGALDSTIRAVEADTGASINILRRSAWAMERSTEAERNLLKKPLDEILADPLLAKDALKRLEESGMGNSESARLIRERLSFLKENASAFEAYEKTFGKKFDRQDQIGVLRGESGWRGMRDVSSNGGYSSEILARWEKSAMSGILETDFPVGNSVRTSSGSIIEKTGENAIVIKTPGGAPMEFRGKEAGGALSMVDLLMKSGADFLIPAMREIAKAADVNFGDSLTPEEARKTLASLSRTFGYRGIENESDLSAMSNSFAMAAAGMRIGSEKRLAVLLKENGAMSESGSLNRERFGELVRQSA